MSAPLALSKLDDFLLRWKAKGLLFFGMRAKAVEVFQEILQRSPNHVHAMNSLGFDAMQTGHPAQALAYFEKVLTLTPDTDLKASNAHFNVAFVSEILGKLEEAEREFRVAISLEEKMDRAWYGLGLVLIRQKRFDEAMVALKRNTVLQPMSPFAWYQMARVHMLLEQPEEARKVIRHLKGFEPKVAAQLERETGMQVSL
ncbi:MAG TPA: tetratricopeptide repeat protein [Burkholderiaceae bacterium]|nr:tetratricopeptide repeat protein [Burkholderiaceae bacterium]